MTSGEYLYVNRHCTAPHTIHMPIPFFSLPLASHNTFLPIFNVCFVAHMSHQHAGWTDGWDGRKVVYGIEYLAAARCAGVSGDWVERLTGRRPLGCSICWKKP